MKKNIRFFGLVLLASICLSGCCWSKKKTDQESKKKHALADKSPQGIPLAGRTSERKTFREDLSAYDSEDDDAEVILSAAEIETIENNGTSARIAYDKEAMSLQKIYFDYDKKEIDDRGKIAAAYDAKVIQNIDDLDEKTIVAEGHCDDHFISRTYNIALSEQRARTAAKEVAERSGVKVEAIKTIGYGSERPAVLKPGQKEALNRRVEFEILSERVVA